MKFGEKLKKYRKKSGMTQAQLAKAAGTSLKTITNYESGSTYPTKREIYKVLAEILGVNPDYLHNENDEFISHAAEKYGYNGKKQAQALVYQMGGLFAGGDLSEEDMDGVMKAMQDVYWKAKEKNQKYAKNKSDK